MKDVKGIEVFKKSQACSFLAGKWPSLSSISSIKAMSESTINFLLR
jgi:hypothetical protein